MGRFLATFIFFFALGAHGAEAHVPNLVSVTSPDDVIVVSDPGLSQAFYGALNGFPHMYEVALTEPTNVFFHILVPDISEAKNDVSGLIVKVPPGDGRVALIARLPAKDGEWNAEFEPWGGDTYRLGPRFEENLEPGTYRFEVSTPDNVEKYVLVVGKREEMTIGYFELIRRLAGVKEFFGKSQLRVVESPFVYVPLLVLIILGMLIRYMRRPRQR